MSISEPVDEWVTPSYYGTGCFVANPRRTEIGSLKGESLCLALNPNHKDAILLKSNILEDQGRHEEAASLKEDAEFLPEKNWTESVSVQ